MNLFRAIYVAIIMCAFVPVVAQETTYDFQIFNTEDGLSNQLVNSIFEDSRGFIWVGTTYGLNRFDGHEFKIFTSEKNGLLNNKVDEIFEDVNHKLWLITYSGTFPHNTIISIFDQEKEKAEAFSNYFPEAPFDESDLFISSTISKNQNIWVSTKKGKIYKYDGSFNLIVDNSDYAFSQLKIIDGETGVWMSSKNYLIHIDENGKELERIILPYESVKNFGKNVEGKTWVTFHHTFDIQKAIFLIDENNEIQNFASSDFPFVEGKWNNVYHYNDQKNREDEFYWRSAGSLLLMNNKGELIYNFSDEISELITGYHILEILVDNRENIWAATLHGLILISPKKKLFQTFLENKNISVRGISEISNDELFVATYNGFYSVNKKNGIETMLKSKRAIFFDYGIGVKRRNNDFLIGFHGAHYLQYNIDSEEFSVFPPFEDSILPEKFNPDFFFEDNSNKIWAGGYRGIRILDSVSQELIFPKKADTSSLFYSTRINHITENAQGLWVSSDQGLFLVSHDGEPLKRIKELENYKINFSHQTQNGEFWLTTKGRGLLHWNPKSKEIQRWTTKEGMPHDFLYSIHEDDFGMFWIPSNNGLIRFNPQNFSINTFDKSDGLPSQEFNSFSHFESDDGKIYLGTLNGIISFNPNDFKFIDEINPKLEIISFVKTKLGNETKLNETRKLRSEKEITFLNDDLSIELSFSILDYKNNYRSKYAYKIEGYHPDWNYLEENFLKINKLPYGNYVLKIKGQGSYGKWSNQILEYPLHFPKPFYLSKWFLIFSSLCLIGLGFGVFRWRIYLLEKEKNKLEQKVAERTQELGNRTQELANLNKLKDDFFAIIAHDLRAPVIAFQNISNRIKYLMQQGDEKDIERMLSMVDNAAENLNVLLDNLLNWALVQKGIFPYNPKDLDLKEISDETISLFEPMAKIKGIKLEQKIEPDVIINADRDAMSTVLRNLVSNAIKYSSDGAFVKISAKQLNKKVQLKIEDSGIGIPDEIKSSIFLLNPKKVNRGTKGEKGSGIGLVLCKHLIEINQGNIEVKSEYGKGTAFSVMLPV